MLCIGGGRSFGNRSIGHRRGMRRAVRRFLSRSSSRYRLRHRLCGWFFAFLAFCCVAVLYFFCGVEFSAVYAGAFLGGAVPVVGMVDVRVPEGLGSALAGADGVDCAAFGGF